MLGWFLGGCNSLLVGFGWFQVSLADDAYSVRSTWSCYWLDQFLTLALNTLILSIFYISLDLSTIYFTHFSGCWASFVCSCHSILECCVMFSGVKLSIRSFVLFNGFVWFRVWSIRYSRFSCGLNLMKTFINSWNSFRTSDLLFY